MVCDGSWQPATVCQFATCRWSSVVLHTYTNVCGFIILEWGILLLTLLLSIYLCCLGVVMTCRSFWPPVTDQVCWTGWKLAATIMLTSHFLHKVLHEKTKCLFAIMVQKIMSTNNIDTNIDIFSGFVESRRPQSNLSMPLKVSQTFSFLFGFHLFALDWLVIMSFLLCCKSNFIPPLKTGKVYQIALNQHYFLG